MDLTSEACFYVHNEWEVAGILLGNLLCFIWGLIAFRGRVIIP